MELLIIPGALLFIFCAYSFTGKPHYAVSIIILTEIVNVWFIKQPMINFVLHIYLFDPVFILIFVSALIRLVFFQQYLHSSPLWIVLGILFFFNMLAGIKLNGTMAPNEFRGYFYYWAGALYFMSFQYSNQMLEKIQKNWFWTTLILLAIVYFRFVAEALHLPIAQTWIAADSTGVRFRVVSAADSFILGSFAIMTIIRYLVPEAKKPSKIILIVYLVAVLVLQHRSVWAFVLCGTAASVFLPGIKTTKLVQNVVLLGIIGFILLAPLIFSSFGDIFMKSIGDSAEKATHLSTGTFGARVEGWYGIMDVWVKQPFLYHLLGEPMGGGYAGSMVAPHNYYVQMLLRSGIVGIIVFLVFYLITLAKLYLNVRRYPEDKLFYATFFMLVIGQMAYYIPYGAHEIDGVILGIAASLAKRRIAVDDIQQTQGPKNQQYFLNTPVINRPKKIIST